MNIVELIERFRIKADDKKSPYRWPDTDLIRWYADSEEEAAIRGRLIKDTTSIAMSTPSAATLAATTGTLNDATYSYRVSATNASGETLASTAATLAVVLGAGANGVTVTWTAVTGAKNYKIYGRTGGSELLLDTVDEATLTYTDDGSDTPAGALPTTNTTEDVVKIAITAGRTTYPLHESIIEVTKAYITDGTTDYPLYATDFKRLDETVYDWRNVSQRPEHYVHEDEEITLGYIPDQAYTMMMEVRRKPLTVMSSYATTTIPEIDTFHHRRLVDYVLWQAYLCRNVDKYSPTRAKDHEEKFTAYFGPRPDFRLRRLQESNRPHRVVCHW